MVQIADYNSGIVPTWCPGCGNFGIWNSVKQALVEMEIAPHEAVITYDIGCSGNGADKVRSYAFKSLHGRTIPVSVGVKLANPKLKVISTGGDGGILEEGVNHFMWAARSNYDISVVLHNNQIFGLTTGQPTVTTEKGQPAKTSPYGVIESRINPIHLALISGATFVARGYSGEPQQLTKLIKQAITHKGFAFLEVLQPCVTYNKHNTFQWFGERVYKLEDQKTHNPADWKKAFDLSTLWQDKIPLGIIYQDKTSVPYSEQLPHRKGKATTLVEEVKKQSIREFIKEFH